MTKTKRLVEALNGASSFLKANGREERAAHLLLQHELGLSQAGLLASLRDPIDPDDYSRFWKKIEQHAKGTPVQHLTGVEEFYGRVFRVDKNVLIPRPETEELVEEALQLIERHIKAEKPAIADIGTGSGIIAVTMKCELPEASVTATDISAEALKVAAENARKLQADVHFEQGDLTEPINGEKWDVILSNPPYIAHAEAPVLSDSVRDFEPHTALFADNDGLALYEKMARQLPNLLNKPGIAGFEIGHTQGQAVKRLLQTAFPEAIVYVKQDINKKDRMVFCINE